MNKLISIFFAFSTLIAASSAFATQPCESGSNGDCSWTCSGGTFNVTCNNPDGPDRCYVVSNGTTCSAGCSDFGCYSVVPFNPMMPEATEARSELTVEDDDAVAPTPTPAPTPRRGEQVAPSRTR